MEKLKDIMTYGVVPVIALTAAIILYSCEVLDNDINIHGGPDAVQMPVPLKNVAALLSDIPLGKDHIQEVYDAVSASSGNGYDEEYTMRDLFLVPGAGVGDDRLPEGTKAPAEYANPLRDLIKDHLTATRSSEGLCDYGEGMTPEEFMAALEASDIQIYWPYSENWDGDQLPIITYDPMDGAETNIGYELISDAQGNLRAEEVIVGENMAMTRAVWVVNCNDDGDYTSLELLRRADPEWGSGGGSITVGTKSGESPLRTLVLRDFTMLRNYDPWFAGASEFFVKMGSVESFTASTEAEMKLYNPSVTDFMIVVKRSQKGVTLPFNAVLVSDWTDQLESCAFMITEDDGGTKTSWKCTALVRVASRSYGVELELPINTKDDIVWRGQLSSKYINANNKVTGHFGDVDLTFEILEY